MTGTKKVGVYPNPYYANAVWDAPGERTRKIYFYNLPRQCAVKIYTLAGDVVAEFKHDAATYNGSDIQWFQQFGGSDVPLQFAGGEHAWDLITKFDQAIATGLYLFSVKDRIDRGHSDREVLWSSNRRRCCMTASYTLSQGGDA